MILGKYFTLFANPVWAIYPGSVRGLLASLPEIINLHARDTHAMAADGDPKLTAAVAAARTAPGAKLGILRISGPIVKGMSPDECRWYGLCDIDIVHRAAAQVQAEGINHLVIHFDSPGGMVCGVPEAAARLGTLRESGVTLTAYTDTMACSAAYWLASACNEIVASPTAIVGSIGCICLGTDTSGLWEKFGVKPEFFVSEGSEAKLYGRGGLPWSDEARASYQKSVDDVGREFKGFIGKARSGIAAADMNGEAWEASGAPAGYVDHTHVAGADGGKRPISTLDDLLALLA